MKRQPFILRIYLCVLLSVAATVYVHGNSGSPAHKEIAASCAPLSNSVTNLTICNNQLPYTWNNITCLTAGTYSATLTGSNGTDSIAVLNLSVINVGISITNAVICDNQLPYNWNGHSYTSSGTYSVTLTSSGGCDSVPILSLTVNNFVTSTTSRTVCSNQLPFNWNGNSYTAAGTYTVTLRSAAGCDSIASLVLSVKPVAVSTTAVTICSNQLPYIWNGRTYSVSGLYLVTLAASNGCDSVAKLDLKVNPTASSTTRLAICSNQLPYMWNGRTCGAAGFYSVVLRSFLNCDSVASLVLTVQPVKTSTTAVTVCTSQLPYTWNGNVYPVAGTYTVTLTASNGCDSVAKLQLSSAAFLTSTTDHDVCNSELPYTWNGNSYNTGGTYTASFVTANGCDSVATLNLKVISPSTGTDSLLICADLLPYNYHGHIFTGPGDYEIVPPVVLDACHSVDSINIKVHVIPPGTSIIKRCSNQLPYIWNGQPFTLPGQYSITLTSTSGCDSVANLDLSVNTIYLIDTTVKICSNQTPYHWNGSTYTSSVTDVARLTSIGGCDSVVTLHLVVNPVQSSLTAITVCNAQVPFTWNGNTYSTSGTYQTTLTSSTGCDSVATLHLFVQSFLTSTTTITVCDNQLPFHWNGNTYPAAGTYSVNLLSSAGCDSLATLHLVINNVITSTTDVNTCTSQLPYLWNGNTYTTDGTYSVTLVTNGGCDSVATLRLHVGSPATSTTSLTICNNQLPYTWNGNIFPIAGTYPVTLTSSSGCDSIATLILTVKAILTSTTNVNLCTSQLPYTWSGNSYSSGGTYSVTLTTVAGCDSVPVLSLTIVPYVTSTTDITICSNELPYTWNGHTYTSAGTYAVLLTGTGVCDSLATLNLEVRAPAASTTAVSVCPSQLPYNWNGQLYTATGTYSTTITNSLGCDSTATLNLSVRTVAISTTTKRICNNQLPYTWNGRPYSATGTYSVTLAGSNGCDSVATLNLVVNPVTRSSTQLSICRNQLPYTWNGNTYLTAGTYADTLTGIEGCDSIATLQLAVTLTATSNTIVQKCSNQLPFSWNGHSYSSAGIYRDTLQSSGGCDSVATLQLIVNAVTMSNTVVTTCSSALPYTWNGHSYSSAGTYSVTLSGSSGCDSVASLQLVVRAVSTSSTRASTCANQLPYLWNGSQYTASGNYAVTLTNAAGCDSIATLQLVVNPLSATTTVARICSGQLPYVWNGQNYTSTGLHVITLSSAAGCDSVATLNLTVDPTPLSPATSPLTYCQYDPVGLLTATITSAGSQLLWYNAATGGTGSPAAPVPTSLVAGTTSYYVSQVNGNCESPRALLTVTINSKPALGPDKNIKLCFADSLNLDGLYNTTGYTVTWTSENQPLLSNIVTATGVYQLVVKSSGGCVDTGQVRVTILPKVFADAGNDDNAEYNAPYQLSGNGNGQFEWLPHNPLSNPFIANPTAILTADQTFNLTVKNELGCTAVDTVKLRVLRGPSFHVPSAFTPNSDGKNDIFRPTPVGIASMEYFRVFNRYGEMVYETSNLHEGWDGTYKGVKQNPGNYVWMIKGTDRFGELKMLKGNVVLIR